MRLLNWFALFSFPCLIGYVVSYRSQKNSLFIQIGSAVLAALPVGLLIFLLRTWSMRMNWALEVDVLFKIWILDFGLPLIASFFCYLLFLRMKILDSELSGFVWFLGFFYLFVILRVVRTQAVLGVYEYFYYPLMCISLSYQFALYFFIGSLRKIYPVKLALLLLIILLLLTVFFPILAVYTYYIIHRGILTFAIVFLQIILIFLSLTFCKVMRKIIWES